MALSAFLLLFILSLLLLLLLLLLSPSPLFVLLLPNIAFFAAEVATHTRTASSTRRITSSLVNTREPAACVLLFPLLSSLDDDDVVFEAESANFTFEGRFVFWVFRTSIRPFDDDDDGVVVAAAAFTNDVSTESMAPASASSSSLTRSPGPLKDTDMRERVGADEDDDEDVVVAAADAAVEEIDDVAMAMPAAAAATPPAPPELCAAAREAARAPMPALTLPLTGGVLLLLLLLLLLLKGAEARVERRFWSVVIFRRDGLILKARCEARST